MGVEGEEGRKSARESQAADRGTRGGICPRTCHSLLLALQALIFTTDAGVTLTTRAVDLSGLTVSELQAKLVEFKLNTNGQKEVLAARVEGFLSAQRVPAMRQTLESASGTLQAMLSADGEPKGDLELPTDSTTVTHAVAAVRFIPVVVGRQCDCWCVHCTQG